MKKSLGAILLVALLTSLSACAGEIIGSVEGTEMEKITIGDTDYYLDNEVEYSGVFEGEYLGMVKDDRGISYRVYSMKGDAEGRCVCCRGRKKSGIYARNIWAVEMPDDFSFSLVFNVYGISSYDSASGRLVKTTDATHPEDYVTEYYMTEAELESVYRLVVEMEPETYPAEFDPVEGCSKPSRDIVLTVSCRGVTKNINCQNISLSNETNGEMGRKFMAVHDRITEILFSTDAWKALPEYERLYD